LVSKGEYAMREKITLEDAQASLAESIAALTPGKEYSSHGMSVLVAKLVGQGYVRLPRKPGRAVGKLIIHADHDEHLADSVC
jgi:hypothetical protein